VEPNTQECTQSEQRRIDRDTERVVNLAIAFHMTLGERVARAYLREKNVSSDIIDRVLDRAAQRRR
jgi:hypothetical protein